MAATQAPPGSPPNETGHAIQHAKNYFPMWLARDRPRANLGSTVGPWLIIIGIILRRGREWASGRELAIFGVIFVRNILHTVTVPVEFNASPAKERLQHLQIVQSGDEYVLTVSGVLFAAGLTYVAAAITSVMQLLYWAPAPGFGAGGRLMASIRRMSPAATRRRNRCGDR